MAFVNLYIQTEYSMLNSVIPIKKLVKTAKDLGFNSIAITDDNMHGVIKFYQECKKNNIKPIVGLRLRLNENNFLLLYAKSYNGYQNLLNLASVQALQEEVSFEVLKKHHHDIIAIIPSDENESVKRFLDGNYKQTENLFNLYQEIFTNDLYLGLDLQTNIMIDNIKGLISFSKKHNIKPVAINKTNYLIKEDFDIYEIIKCIGLGINNYAYTEKETNSYFLINSNLFKDFPELIENTNMICQQCNLKLTFGKYRLPKYDSENSETYLFDLCKVGLNKRLANRNVNINIYRNRLLHELDIIRKMGFSDYFLIVYDYVKYAKKNNIIVGPGRGSAPGSLVSYCLGITDIDPLKYDLLFERFLNPERISMPDIDVDFPDNKRDEVIKYIGKRYGTMRVAHISTFGTFGARSAIRDVARVRKLSSKKLEVIIKYIPSSNIPLKELMVNNDEIVNMISKDQEIERIFVLASKIDGLPRHLSTHAAGIIMADQDLVAYTPLQKGINGLYQTQYEARDLEALGLVKMDILGLRNLTIIDEVLKSIKKTTGKDLNLNKIPLDDEMVYRMIASGDTDGIFQLESKGMRNVLRKLKASTFMDIVHANALFRPGPMEMIPHFIARKFRQEPVSYIHPDLEEILKSTYGTIVFQEQIMLIAEKFAGYSLGMADILRRAVSKKDQNLLDSERKRFVGQAIKKGYSSKLSNEVYNYIAKFANYGFNKSHSVAYAIIAYQMGYLKVHYYKYFMAVLMTNSIGSTRLLHSYIVDCKKKNIEVEPPDINISRKEFVVLNKIYFSLLAISNIGHVVVEKIIQEREKQKFNSYDNFVVRSREFINKRIIASLIHAGSFDSFGVPRREMIETYDDIIRRIDFQNALGDKIVPNSKQYPEYSFDEISQLEKEALGFNLKYNLFIKYADLRKKEKTVLLANLIIKTKVKILFIIKGIKKIHTKKGDEMAFLEIYDDSGNCDAVLFPNIYESYKQVINENAIYLADAKVDSRNGKIQVILENVYSVN